MNLNFVFIVKEVFQLADFNNQTLMGQKRTETKAEDPENDSEPLLIQPSQ